ncbi:MAG TPA: tRNA pseudouridine(38-40) synthase TruA [Candidatus Mcinerneyibacteriales bacterium]|nr:tRNA pseudouridine(38-40) synthase TruA [Candidatus Mcinerneyibacteriales bacterium]
MYTYYRGKVAYDGTAYKGWQLQRRGICTVQGMVEEAFSGIFDTDRIKVQGASRTDSGVHARGQVIHFRAHKEITPLNVLRGANTFLPRDIRILELDYSDRSFHPIFSAFGKHYSYSFIYPDDPLKNRYAYRLPHPADFLRMEKALSLFTGEKDFSAFRNMASRDPEKSPVCHIRSFSLEQAPGVFTFHIKGNRFLYNMIRIIMGTLLYLGLDKLSEEDIVRAFETGDRHSVGKTLAPDGLILEEVYYSDDY